MRKLILNLALILFLIAIPVQAFTVNAYFENGEAQTSINNQDNAKYYIDVIMNSWGVNGNIDVKLYDQTNSFTLLGQLEDISFTDQFYFSPELLITSNDYGLSGEYLIDIKVTQTNSDGSETVRSETLELTVEGDRILIANFTFNPENPKVGESVTFTSTSQSDTQIQSYVWTYNSNTIGTTSEINHVFNSAGTKPVTLTITDEFGASNSLTKQVVVSEVPPPIGPTADFTFNPSDPFEGDEVTFSSTSVAGDNPIVSYIWEIDGVDFNDQEEFSNVFSDFGTFEVKLTVIDQVGLEDSVSKQVVVSEVALPPTGPTADFIFSPNAPVEGDEVIFESTSVQGDGDIITFVWRIDNTIVGMQETLSNVFDDPGTYTVRLSVMDSNGLFDTKEKQVIVSEQEIEKQLIIDELGCNENVVQGKNQHCSVHVSSNIEDDVVGAQVTFKYLETDEVLGVCSTNNAGYCHISPIINKEPGVYKVYAIAQKQDYLSDNSKLLSTQFTVWSERYEVLALTLYEDPYVTESYEFYRANPIYSSFSVRDMFTGQILTPNSDLISEVFIKVNNEQELQFEEDTFTSNQFRYFLSSIPITNDFLGEGQVFSFVFNFTDGTAGQDSVSVNILNNEIEFDLPSSFEFEANEQKTIDFKPFVSDVETPSDEVVFTFTNIGDFEFEDLGENIFRFTAPDYEINQFISVTADDTDGSLETKQTIFKVTKEEVPPPTGPTADFIFSPVDPVEGDAVLFESISVQGDAPIVSYEWRINGGIVSSEESFETVFNDSGSYNVYLKVTDENGLFDTKQEQVTVDLAPVPPVGPTANFTFVPSEPLVGDLVLFESASVEGDAPIVLYEWRVNGELVSTNETYTETFNTSTNYQVSLNVTDSNNLSDSITKTITINEVPGPTSLILDELGCNANVVEGDEQYCSAHVSFENGQDASNVEVEFLYKESQESLGVCQTNNFGYCSISSIINKQPGIYNVTAIASKQGFESDLTQNIVTQFTVWDKRYEVQNLKLYEDEFVNENYVYYRGEKIWAAFDVFDTFTGQTLDPSYGIVSEVVLRVQNANPLVFEELNLGPISGVGMFKHYLNKIPLTNDYLGSGAVFAFAFNFTDGTAGQASVNLTVLNNELEFNPPTKIVFNQEEIKEIDFKPFVDDVETPSDEVTFTFENLGDFEFEDLGSNVFRFTAPFEIGSTMISVTADDNDGSKIIKTIEFEVIQSIFDGPTSDFVLLPENESITQFIPVTLMQTASSGDNPITSYEWRVNGEVVSTEGNFSYAFENVGQNTVSLRVVDSIGLEDTKTRTYDVENAINPVANFTFTPQNPIEGEEVTFTQTSVQGSFEIVSFDWIINGVSLQGEEVTFVFDNEGVYEVTLIVTDEIGQHSSVTAQIVVSSEPTSDINAILAAPSSTLEGRTITLDGSQSTSTETIVSYNFRVYRFDELIFETTTAQNSVEFDVENRGRHNVVLTVTDSTGNSATDSKQMDVARDMPRTVEGDFEGLHLSNIEILGSDILELSFNEYFSVYATVTNNKDVRIDNLRLTFSVPELGYQVKGNAFSLRPGESLQRAIHDWLPEEFENFPYSDIIVEVGVSGSGFNRNIYVPVDVAN
ncbi:MAG: PKD domain-containing protein [Candidatus Woesearchaeota archaeon]